MWSALMTYYNEIKIYQQQKQKKIEIHLYI